MKIVNEWTDDHVACFTAEHKGVECEFWYIGWEMKAAALYFDDGDQAKADFTKMVEEQIKDCEDKDDGDKYRIFLEAITER